MSANVGVVGYTLNTAEFVWRIADFFSLPERADEHYRSPGVFRFSDASWYLRIYPHGQKEKYSFGRIGIFIVKEDSGPPVTLTYKLGLKTADGVQETEVEDTATFDQKDIGYGGLLISRAKLMERKSELVPSDVLIISCSLRQNVPEDLKSEMKLEKSSIEAPTQTEAELKKLLQDLDELMLNVDDSDVTVQVKGEEFRLHRCILRARTPVFSSMFKHEMREKTTGTVTIDDCEADTFRVFLRYVYMGAVDKLSPENAFGLYELADKYQVDELKAVCLEYIKNTLSVDTFCDAIALALTHDEKELTQLAVDLLSDKMAEILMTVNWQNFLKKSPTQANELLIKAAVRNKNKFSSC